MTPASTFRAVALGLVVAVATTAWAWRPLWGIDIFWHVVVGRLIADGGIPATDVLSAAHPETPWTTFQWGYERLVAAIDAVWGPRGLRGAHAIVIGAAAGIWACAQARRGGLAVGVGSSATLLLLFEDRVRARPHVFELFLILALFSLLRWAPRPASGGRDLRPWLAVLIAPIWANLHAVSALWWLAIVGAWVVGCGPRPGWRARLAALGLGAALFFSAPGALGGLSMALLSHREWPAAFVPELQRTAAYVGWGPWGWAMLTGAALGSGAAVARVVALRDTSDARAPGVPFGPRLYEALALVGFAAACWLIVRWSWLAAIPLAVALERRPRISLAFAALSVGLLGWRVGDRWTVGERLTADLQPAMFPEAACDFMDETGLRLPTDADPQWSGYLLYRLHPGATVLADGRLIFGEDVADMLRRRFDGDAQTFDEAVGRFRTLALVMPTGSLPELSADRWRQVYRDPVAEVWLPSPAWGALPKIETWYAARGLAAPWAQ